MRVTAGAVVIAFSVVFATVSGNWPSLGSLLDDIVFGLVVGVAIGLVLRFMLPSDVRRDLVDRINPGLSAHLVRRPSRKSD